MVGILRMLASGSWTSQGKEGNVVLLLPALPHEGVQFLQENVTKWPLLSVLGNECPQPREAEHLALRVVGLYQSIAVEQCYLASIEFDLLLLVAHAWHKPKGHPSRPQLLCLTVTAAQVGQVVASVG